MKTVMLFLGAALCIAGCSRNFPNYRDQTPPKIKWTIKNLSNNQSVTLFGNQKYTIEKNMEYFVTATAEDDGGLKEFIHFTTFGFDCQCGDDLFVTTPGPSTSGPVNIPLPLDAEGKAQVYYSKIFKSVIAKGDCRGRQGCISNEFFLYQCSAGNYNGLNVENTLSLELTSY